MYNDSQQNQANGDLPVDWVDLILIYSGWKFGKLLDLKIKDGDLNQMTFRGRSKTKSDKGQIVPIHFSVFERVKLLLTIK